MKAGTLDRRVSIQRRTLTQASDGSEIETWANISVRRPASMYPVKGEERFANPEKTAREQIEFRVRYSSDVAALTPVDRLIYPALTDAQAADASYVIPTRSIHDVLFVLEIGRRQGLKIVTERRSDVTT